LGGFAPPDFGCDYEFFQRADGYLWIEKVDFPTYVYHRDFNDSMCRRQSSDDAEPDLRGGTPSEGL